MPTIIVFTEGTALTVSADAKDVRKALSKDKKNGEPFTQFEGQGRGDVYIAADQVAYLQRVGSS